PPPLTVGSKESTRPNSPHRADATQPSTSKLRRELPVASQCENRQHLLLVLGVAYPPPTRLIARPYAQTQVEDDSEVDAICAIPLCPPAPLPTEAVVSAIPTNWPRRILGKGRASHEADVRPLARPATDCSGILDTMIGWASG